jgi:hypothetical protein
MSEVERPENMVPARRTRRSRVERGFMRVVATGGVVGIGVAVGAILSNNGVAGWLVGLVVSVVSLLLAAILWSSRQL